MHCSQPFHLLSTKKEVLPSSNGTKCASWTHTLEREMITSTNSLWRLLYFWLPPVIWMGLIFYVSSQPGTSFPDLGGLDLVAKKGAHILEYAVLYLLLFRALSTLSRAGRTSRRAYLLPMLLAILYAISDEVHQTFVPSREGTIRDVLIDSFGVLIAYLSVRWWTRRP